MVRCGAGVTWPTYQRQRLPATWLAGTVKWCEDDSQRVVSHSSCDHDDPCGCYAEGHAAGAVQGREERRAGTLELIARLREILDDFEEAWK